MMLLLTMPDTDRDLASALLAEYAPLRDRLRSEFEAAGQSTRWATKNQAVADELSRALEKREEGPRG